MSNKNILKKMEKKKPIFYEGLIERGSVFYADLGSNIGSEQGGTRPVVVIQNNTGNKFSPTVIIATISTTNKKGKQPTHVKIQAPFMKISTVLLEQIKTIDKSRLLEKIGDLDEFELLKVDRALRISLAL